MSGTVLITYYTSLILVSCISRYKICCTQTHYGLTNIYLPVRVIAVYFTIPSTLRSIMYYRKYEILHVPKWCVVCGVVVFCASFGYGRVGLWADDDSPRFPKTKIKMPPRKPMGKGLSVPGNLEKVHPPPKKSSKETSESHRFTCWLCSCCVSKSRCACRDPLRRAKLRLVQYCKTNLSCHIAMKTCPFSKKRIKTTCKTRLSFMLTLRRATLPYSD